MQLRVDPASAVSPSRQIAEALLDAMASGELKGGDRLPSVRSLAAEVLVNPNTVERAMRELQGLGVAEGRSGAGVFVTATGPAEARRLRRAATLRALRQALRAAERAGHAPRALRARVRRWLEPTVQPQAQGHPTP